MSLGLAIVEIVMFVRVLFEYIDTRIIILVENRVHLNSARVNADLRYANSIRLGGRLTRPHAM